MDFLFSEGTYLFMRWIHFLAGVVWIGHLYYFNFVQGSFFAEIDAQTKNTAIAKLVPRALYWFRWGAMWTFLSGLYILLAKGHTAGMAIYSTSWGISILTGALLGTLMFLNVWLIIWPNQKVVIQSANQVLGGGQPIAEAAACGAKALLASRTNTLFSIPMLLFMGMASHYTLNISPDTKLTPYWFATLLVIGVLEFNAIKGKLSVLATVKGVISAGFVLTLVLFMLGKLLI